MVSYALEAADDSKTVRDLFVPYRWRPPHSLVERIWREAKIPFRRLSDLLTDATSPSAGTAHWQRLVNHPRVQRAGSLRSIQVVAALHLASRSDYSTLRAHPRQQSDREAPQLPSSPDQRIGPPS